ncbi:UDP-N-acetylenolpyruvoylglucosamine reductase [Frankliniella fusca]|uniref:UDP-N-acetylenolpyruvoylglucosamine reductase n=1 Tax=Frankliniella fusca TaxID=407009 RepID=A0AAE1HMI5_9NEOP|nr:UDP-N-acetylenolpyruvoylglucosamine reductase [Frankliniella fusca]
MSVEDAWVEIGSLKNGLDEPMFPQLSRLASLVKILPHSNADSERMCALRRNRLAADSLNAVCVSRISFRSKYIDSASFQATKDHLQRHNKYMCVRK